MTDLPAPRLAAPTREREPRTAPRVVTPERRGAVRRWWRRRPLNRALVVLHRWPALIIGLLLVIETTTGAVLLYNSEIFRATHSNLYHYTAGGIHLEPAQAIELVAQQHPGFGAAWVGIDHGVYAVGNADYDNIWFVDPGSGRLNGRADLDDGFLGLLVNIHDCAFSCEGYPGYTAWLAGPVWADGPTFLTGITWGGLILGLLGLLMILLFLTGLKIWWPGIRKLRSRFAVRTGKGRFACDYDLHNVIAAIALPFLLMWGVTGAAFEFPVVEKAWLALTGGDQPKEVEFALVPDKAPKDAATITPAQAVDVALARVPGRATWIGVPTEDTPYYEIDIVSGYGAEQYRAVYSGDSYVLVDPHDAGHVKVIDSSQGDPLANRFYDKYFEPSHFGWQVNGWWRSIWAVMGLAPLALFVTGVSTWLYRRGVKRRRRNSDAPVPA